MKNKKAVTVKWVSLLLVLVLVLPMNVMAVESRASYYLDAYSAYVYPAGWGKVADFCRAADQIAAYSQWLKDFCTAFGGQYVDFRQDFLKPDGTVRRELFVDGLHPNGEGHALMAKRLIDAGVLA